VTHSPLVDQILKSLDREVMNQLDLAAAIEHPGKSGRAREQIIASFFRRLVPKEFGIDTGFVFDALGEILGDVASEIALWQLVEMPREARLDEGAQRGKRVLGSNVP
jgi:hypothetical protein